MQNNKIKTKLSRKSIRSIKSSKAQMEIMGLAIVIILVILGMFFAIRFIVLKPTAKVQEEYTRSQLSSNFGITLLQSSTEACGGTDLTELITDCAEFSYIVCDDGRDSCAYANATIDSILQQTLVEWKVPYHIKVFLSNEYNPIFNFSNRGCSDNQPGKAEPFFLPSDRGPITFKIFICERGT